MTYVGRIVDSQLREYLKGSLAVSIEGPRAVGKTSTASRVAHSVVRLDDPDTRLVASADRIGYLSELDAPVLVDEWQLDPPIWDAVRRLVDDEQRPGRFVLTGSANPGDARMHSGAGRFLRLRMRPLSFAERGLQSPTVSLSALWHGERAVYGRTSVTVHDYAREIVDSGFPGVRREPTSARHSAINDYLGYAIEHEVPELGGLRRRPRPLRAWLSAYAAAVSSTTSLQSIARAVAPDASPSKTTIAEYREILSRLWLLDEIPAWLPGRVRLNHLGQAPKHQLADPALVAALLGTDASALIRAGGGADSDPRLRDLRDGPLLGALFESLTALSLRVYAQPLRVEVSHLRTHRGDREIDLILHGHDGRAIAVEVKLAAAADDHDVRHLNWLHAQLGSDLVDRIVVTTGERAYRRPDGVAVVPLALLGP